MSVRLVLGRPVAGIVGETKRVVHLFPEPDAYPDRFTAFCGADFWSGDLEWLDGIKGMPCTACLMASPQPEPQIRLTARAVRTPGPQTHRSNLQHDEKPPRSTL
jgi:hypothetical protein